MGLAELAHRLYHCGGGCRCYTRACSCHLSAMVAWWVVRTDTLGQPRPEKRVKELS
jgi:hypothetical protein